MVLRLALIQKAMRPVSSFAEFEEHVRALVGAAINRCRGIGRSTSAGRGTDMVVLPEYTGVELSFLSMSPEGRAHRASFFRMLAGALTPWAEAYERLLASLAREHRVWLAGATHLKWDSAAGAAYNSAYLIGPQGEFHVQFKQRLVPEEQRVEGLAEGRRGERYAVRALETPWTRLGLMTCYDAEFPEIARQLAVQGAELLLCPSWTATERGFWRVRHSCAARAVENQVFVAHCCHVGSLAEPADQPLTGWGRSAVLGPIDDVTGLVDGVVSEAPANEEHILVVDLDFELIRQSRARGEVRPFEGLTGAHLNSPVQEVITARKATPGRPR